MTNLNELVAKAKGWRRPTKNECAPKDGWISDITHYSSNTVPDYQGDADLYMPLYFELPTDIRMQLAAVKEDEFGEAVCRAWLKMKGIEI